MKAQVTTAPAGRVAYVMSRFPRLTETFVLAEIVAHQQAGRQIELYPLLREKATVTHPETAALVDRARYQPFISTAILRSNLRFLLRSPGRYLRTLGAVVRTTFGSRNFLIGGLAIFPKVVHNALDMKRVGVVHVHCHFANHPALAGLIVHRLVGIPYSFTAHGSDLHVDRRGLEAKVREAKFVVAISEYNRRLIVDECGGRWADKVEVIHCGVHTDRFVPHDRSPSTSLSILCVGTLHEVKGQRHLIDACRLLVARGVPITCTLVGDGEDRAALERQVADAGLGTIVNLVGVRTQPEIVSLLASTDVLVAPSVPTRAGKREGIPVVLMEAMSSGVPVVASNLSGIPELVIDGKTGLLAPPGDASAIADALERLHADAALRTRLARNARQRVLAEFDVRTNAERLARRFGQSGT